MKKLHKDKKGITLITVIVLLVFASIAILGAVTFIVERLALNEIHDFRARTMDLAHAGINGAIYSYHFRKLTGNGYFPTDSYFNIYGDNYFILGGDDADLLMVDTSNALLAGGGRNVINLVLQNPSDSRSITIDRMVVSWDNAWNLRRIRIDGSNLWNGNAPSPVNANLSPDAVINPTDDEPINTIRFNGNMTDATINVEFIMTDGSTKSMTVYPSSNNFNFIVSSTGKTTRSPIWRTIRAEYNILTRTVTEWSEVGSEITP